MKTILKLTLVAAVMLIVSGTNIASAQKYGFVDIQELVLSMPEMKDVQTKLTALQTDLESQMKVMEEEFTKKRDEYERTMPTMTESVKRLKEEELNALIQRIQNFQQSAQEDLQSQHQQLVEPLFEKAQVAINNVAVEQGLAGVFAAGALIYTDKSAMIDVLPLAKKRLGIE